MVWRRKDLLGLRGLSHQEIGKLLDTAVPMKEIIQRDIKKVPTLRGKSMVCLFYEASTRTRTSFELAGKYMSADTVNIAASSSSVVKGESLIDTGRTIDAMGADIIVMRHSASGAAQLLAGEVKARVINAGDGAHEHPTQGLLDMFTIREKKGKLAGLTVTILGDILHSRVARSNIWGLTTMGARVRVCGPSTLLPPEIAALGVEATTDIEAALRGADVVNVLRLQLERQQKGLFPTIREYGRLFGLNRDRLRLCKQDVLVLHPGPMNRGVEIADDVADGDQASIEEQVTNGVAVRMAALYLMMGGNNDGVGN
ncbi:aspartate carbamoyltransferase catalytic subunit [Heliophilum fasciatum]|uniref:Aspartate carbamoyltransferase n=1 Tax=Heliophilum fasciatum TaxID=35700 RepID=A0A4R2RZ46_9FIRM|nr:aspartate carbamoyltransferase catalytic subunit [Heliophilum fasciatum]MCW2277228.1 aspartate carbamoyltransferase catalytic subunit [Heliophilum fasciatum]TCP68137.1 aspartate carbamoyltransferase [Heliophilum fasciatum]